MSEVKMLVGLGNPGSEYANTRHNVGFRVIDLLKSSLEIEVNKTKFAARFGKGEFEGSRLILLKPWQFMNSSGSAVAEAVGFYKIDLTQLLVILDDMWLEPGRIRIRPSGSDGGHNGLADIIQKLGTEDFPRLRVGIGRDDRQDAYDYVLSEPSKMQKPLLDEAVIKAKEAALCWVQYGIEKAMSGFNSVDSERQ